MDSLYDLLSNRNFDEPAEIGVIKEFIREKYQAGCSVTMRQFDIVIIIGSAPLANQLRYALPELKERLKSEKKIVIRIGQI